jgi:hypothetical protein
MFFTATVNKGIAHQIADGLNAVASARRAVAGGMQSVSNLLARA